MPLYEYQCADCRESFEVLQRLGEGAAGLQCPSCGGDDLAKQFSTFAASTAPATGSRSAAPGGAGCGAPAGGTGFT